VISIRITKRLRRNEMKKIITALLLMVSVLFVFTACDGKTEEEKAASTEENLEGYWDQTYYEFDEQSYDPVYVWYFKDKKFTEYRKDSTGAYVLYSGAKEIPYTIEGDKYTLEGYDNPYDYTIELGSVDKMTVEFKSKVGTVDYNYKYRFKRISDEEGQAIADSATYVVAKRADALVRIPVEE